MNNFLTEGKVKKVAVPAGEVWPVDAPKVLGDIVGIVEATNNQVTITTAVGDNGDSATMRLNGVIGPLAKSTATGSGGDILEKAYWNDTDKQVTALTREGGVLSIAVTAGGTGYTGTPTVVFTGGGGTGATATATVSGGAVTAIAVTNAGTGYTSAPTISFTGGAGSGATATATLTATLHMGWFWDACEDADESCYVKLKVG